MQRFLNYILIFVVVGIAISVFMFLPQIQKPEGNFFSNLLKTQSAPQASPTLSSLPQKISIVNFAVEPNTLIAGQKGSISKIKLSVQNNSTENIIASAKFQIINKNGNEIFSLYSIKPAEPGASVIFFDEKNAELDGQSQIFSKIKSGKYAARITVQSGDEIISQEKTLRISRQTTNLPDIFVFLISAIITIMVIYILVRIFIYFSKL